MTVSSPLLPKQTPLDRTGVSVVRCGRCGASQRVDLAQSVLTQVRPFVQLHLLCSGDQPDGAVSIS